jgi:hypothetical protein
LLPYLVALKAINPFDPKKAKNARAEAKNLGETAKLLNSAILTSFSQK